MCGIAGIIDSAPVRHEDLKRMTDALAHRGPDDQGAWTGGNANLVDRGGRVSRFKKKFDFLG